MFQPIGLAAARAVERLEAHRTREDERGRRAAERVRAAGGSSMDAAKAQIDETFRSEACALKIRVLNRIRLGADHPAVRARYRGRAQILKRALSSIRPANQICVAIRIADRWYRDELAAFYPNRLSISAIQECRLILRLVRAKGYAAQFPALLNVILGDELEAQQRTGGTLPRRQGGADARRAFAE